MCRNEFERISKKSVKFAIFFRILKKVSHESEIQSGVSIQGNARKATDTTDATTASILAFWPLRQLRLLRTFLAFTAFVAWNRNHAQVTEFDKLLISRRDGVSQSSQRTSCNDRRHRLLASDSQR